MRTQKGLVEVKVIQTLFAAWEFAVVAFCILLALGGVK